MRFDDVSRGIGYFGAVNATRIDGWILSTPEAPLDSFGLAIDGATLGRSDARATPEVPPPPGADGVVTWFAFEGPFALRQFSRVEVLGCVGGQPVSRMATRVRDDLAAMPAPPEALMMRVTGCDDAMQFKAAGLRAATELLDALSRHRPLDSLHRVLDWGCGTGRVTAHLIDILKPFHSMRVEGADLDKEVIRWANAKVRDGAFTTVKPHPPLPWTAGTFDVVFACSVFAQLTRELQRAWLAEMRRVLVPGGLLLASIAPNSGDDFVDQRHNPALDVAEYVPHGLESLQDLVVLRRRLS